MLIDTRTSQAGIAPTSFQSLQREMAATALTQGHGGKSATFLSGGVEATTASGEATTVTSRPGGVEATTFSHEVQSGHVANDSYGTEEPVKNTKPGQEKEEQIAKDSFETEPTRQ